MTEENNETLNEDGVVSTTDETLNVTGEPSAPKESADLVSTTEFKVESSEEKSKTEESEKTQATENEDDKGKEGDDKDKEKNVPKTVPYDRFQEMVDSKNQWQGRATKAEQAQEKEEPVVHEDALPPNFKDLSVLSSDDLTELIQDKPMDFIRNLATQIQYETLNQVQGMMKENSEKSAQTKQQDGVKATFDKYASENADFNQMWQSGDIKKYMDENPGANAMGAHQVLTRQKAIDDAVAKAVEETEKRKDLETKTKQSAKVLSAGPAARVSTEESTELKETKIHGGLTAVLAKRLAARRQGAQ